MGWAMIPLVSHQIIVPGCCSLLLSHQIIPTMIPSLAIALLVSALPLDGFSSGMAKRTTWESLLPGRSGSATPIAPVVLQLLNLPKHGMFFCASRPRSWWLVPHKWNGMMTWVESGTQTTLHQLKVLLPKFLPYLGYLKYSYIYI